MAYGPAEIEEVLVDRAADFRKSFGTRMLIPLLGRGLLTAEGDEWLRHRRLASPAFHRERVEGYARTMVGYAQDAVDSWTEGESVDLHDEMTALTLRIVARTLFDADVTARIEEVARLGTAIQDFYYLRFASLRFLIPTWLPTPGNRRLAQATRRLDEVVYRIIRTRLPGEDRGDLLSMLHLARDEQGAGMSERQIRDEVMTLLLAGHETTALALSWAFLLLDHDPETRDRLEAELRAVLGDGPASPEHVPALSYTQAVVNETLRLYPPAYVTGREAIRATTVAGVPIPKRHIVLISIYTTHRDPRFFPDPDAFRPERWLDGLEKRLPRAAFIPFGLGPRKCIGASFATMEATLLLATIARRWRFEIAPGEIGTHPSITLRPAAAMPGRMRSVA
jgi:cytochrome P450